MSAPALKNESLIGKAYARRLLELINEAELSIFIMMFDWRWYTDDPAHPIQLINHALVRAVRRGVEVSAITYNGPMSEILKSVGINAKAWPMSNMLHSKMVILDEKILVLGSHNLTGSAMRANIENSVVLYDEETAKAKLDYFKNLWSL